MKHILQIVALAVCLIGFAGCSDSEESPEPTLAVTPAYLDGTWQLAAWNGKPLAEGLYLYIAFHRREGTYELYQNFDSMYARCITGSFRVTQDEEERYIISGSYDFGNGYWLHDYTVSDSYADRMTWTASDDKGDVQSFVRCEGIPEEILDETGHAAVQSQHPIL